MASSKGSVGAGDAMGDDADWRTFETPHLPPILQHALECFTEHGYEGTTVREVARRVGVTVPALYYHYANKQDLLATLLFMAIEDVLWRVKVAHARAGQDPAEQFNRIVEAIVLFQAHHRDLAFLDSELRSLVPDNRHRYIARRGELQQILVDTVHAGRQAGLLATPHPVACSRAILVMTQRVATWYSPEGPLEPEEIARQYIRYCRAVAEFVASPGAEQRCPVGPPGAP